MDTLKHIATASLDLTKSVHDGSYEGILISGGSNQLSRSLFTSAWMAEYPEEHIPKIYILDAEANEMLYKSDLDFEESAAWVRHWIDENLPELNNLKHKKLCFIDDFSATGQKISEAEKVLKEIGFTHINFHVFVAAENNELDREVFIAARNDELVRSLQGMSMNIQKEPSLEEILGCIELTGEERRLHAIEQLREIGKRTRMR